MRLSGALATKDHAVVVRASKGAATSAPPKGKRVQSKRGHGVEGHANSVKILWALK